jgi:hypothetical protein
VEPALKLRRVRALAVPRLTIGAAGQRYGAIEPELAMR